MKQLPFTLKIFVANGDPDGLRIVERSNWTGRALMFPRPLLPQIKDRAEFLQTGLYLLLGPRLRGDGEMVHVGVGDPVGPRLESHFSYKDFWTRAVFFVAGPAQLNKGQVQFLESQLIQRARTAKKTVLDHTHVPPEFTLPEAERADTLLFLEHMLGVLSVLGIHAFEHAAPVQASPAAELMIRKGNWLLARGYESTRGFVVQAGSQAALQSVPSMQEETRRMFDLRQELIDNEVLRPCGSLYEFTQDYTFASPCSAATVVLGRSANGRIEWRDASGRMLRDMQTLQVQPLWPGRERATGPGR